MSTASPAAAPLPRVLGAAWIAIAAGAAVWLGSLALDPAQAWAGLLTASLFCLAPALGALVFIAIQVASGARWWLPVEGVARMLARTLAAPLLGLAVCLVGGLDSLYPWAGPGAAQDLPVVAARALWLSAPLFLARAGVILMLWLAYASAIDARLLAFVEQPSTASRQPLLRASIGFLIVYAFTSSVGMWDWTMSLEPDWFSTMRGVYGFAGTFLAGIAAVTALALHQEEKGLLRGGLPPPVRHDLGKLLFAFATFWGYIWFCEYLLIWYANLPEETAYFFVRQGGDWGMLFWLNPLLSFGVPFAVLMSAGAKRHPVALFQVSLVVLVGRWLDSYLLVQPALSRSPASPLAAIAATIVLLAAMSLLGRRARSEEPGRS